MNDTASHTQLSAEVQLAWEVMTCRAMRNTYDAGQHACRWFNQHYGPFPSFNWPDSLPKEPLEADTSRNLPAVCNGNRYQLPELMSGCRKAPIMTIGINPNLTAFWPGVQGATWAYPYFDDIRRFAHYYRYRSIYQERFPLEFILDHLEPDSEFKAPRSGCVKIAGRSKSDETVTVDLKYDDSTTQQVTLDRGYEVFYDKGQTFDAGEIIAARVALPQGAMTEVIQEEVGYYKRFREILDGFKNLAGLQHADLRMGEDVCQGDMVACASPGWDSWFSDEALKGIVDECVHGRGWLAQQLLQTRPVVIVFAGLSAFGMFQERFKARILPELDPDGDTFEILKDCVENVYRLETETDGGVIDSRILISPHFSYPENFKPQCRFTQEQWKTFISKYPEQVKLLAPVTQQSFDKTRMQVFLELEGAPSKEQLGADAWSDLMDRCYDAVELLSKGIYKEYSAHRLAYDTITGHLARSAGPCQFCTNAIYEFDEGCPYHVKEPAILPSILRNAAFDLVR